MKRHGDWLDYNFLAKTRLSPRRYQSELAISPKAVWRSPSIVLSPFLSIVLAGSPNRGQGPTSTYGFPRLWVLVSEWISHLVTFNTSSAVKKTYCKPKLSRWFPANRRRIRHPFLTVAECTLSLWTSGIFVLDQ
ncbi:hypothetical protein ARMGADRAFT_224627 [Armillaria gallica]|uniref:Uncharacterized protein n=1 Tax=Armillaria gallica TaxID=47427 RepID=A0A2H3E699_ARMGA|nr:hypothetical protein ARMGADRAFT_224627 [Armillaria gallica]